MTDCLKKLTAISLSIFIWGCNGEVDSSSNAVSGSASNTVIDTPIRAEQSSPMLLDFDGIYINENGNSIFYSAKEKYIYIYSPPLPYLDGYRASSNRSILVANKVSSGIVDESSFIKTEFRDHYEYPHSSAVLTFGKNNIEVNIALDDFASPSTYIKIPVSDTEVDLMYQSYLDWSGELIHFTPDDKLTIYYGSCTVTADVKKISYYYSLTSGVVECPDDYSETGTDFSGVLYKAGKMAVVIMKSDHWVYRTTFAL
ncbi:hypothetical protein ACEQ4U_001816 [Vibrio mimicus]